VSETSEQIEAAAERDLHAAISDCEGYCRGIYRDISKATVEKVAKALQSRLAADRAEREERELLAELSTCAVEHQDPRVRYVTVQIPTVTWEQLQAWHEKRKEGV
jgi:vacuolar-type H+-ATPase subunit E/Vma4